MVLPCLAALQGPLCQYALDALESIINFAANCPELQETGGRAAGLGVSSSNSVAPQGSAAQPGGAGGVDLQGLAACLLPQLDVVELLQRVLDSCGSPPRKKRQRLLPFLADANNIASHTQADRMMLDE